MADSTKLTVLKRLTALLEGMSPTAVADVTPEAPPTMAGVVFRGRAVFGDSDPKWMLSILESPRPFTGQFADDGQVRRDLWPIFIQGWCPDDKSHPSDPIYSLLDDVERRLDCVTRTSRDTGMPKFADHYLLGESLDGDGYLITSLEVGPGVVRPPTDGLSSKSFFYLPLQVGLARIAS